MAKSTPFIFVLMAALLINTLSYCSAGNVYCVTPTATSCSSCPHNTHCATLSEYAQETEMYFTSNTTIVFLPGEHFLDTNITVANVARLTMHGKSPSDKMATVVRSGSVGFSLTNMLDFNIYSLVFTSYNRTLSYGSHPASNSALFLQSTQNTKLVDCSFHDNLGTALAVKNTSVTLVDNKFIHNQCVCGSLSKMRELGCGITTFNSNLTFIGNTSFHNITQRAFHPLVNCAGAIWASASSLHFTGTNNFIGNSANGIKGVGAIYVKANTSLSFSGTSNFSHNSAEVGGAISTVGNVALTFNGTNVFLNNSAEKLGGAIFAGSNTLLSFSGITNFTNNSAGIAGGAVATAINGVLTSNGTNNFINNSANSGGAIYALDNTSLIFIGTNNFTHNSAGIKGGAVCITDNAEFTFNGTTNFINNSANSGGAIHAVTNISLIFIGTNNFTHNSAVNECGAVATIYNGVLIFNGTNVFFNNSAERDGGGICAAGNTLLSFSGTNEFSHNSAEHHGGAIFAGSYALLSFSGITNFTNNSAGIAGGAVATAVNSVLTSNGTNNFINNSANSGGAISAATNLSLIFVGTNNFTHNSAGIKGGAVDITDNAEFTFNGTTNFINNSANSGGAICAIKNISLIFIGTNNFTHNSAGIEGGAVATSYNGVLIFDGTNVFFNNSAKSGGAIYALTNISLSFIGTNTVTHSSALNEGGAVAVAVNGVLIFNGTNKFINNSANYGGAISAVINISLILIGTNNFTHNSANTGGGAVFVVTNAPSCFTGTSSFTSNSATQGGAIFAHLLSKVIVNGNINFTNNGHNIRDSRGGAMYLAIDSTFSVLPHTIVYWKNNHANLGGAIYVLTANRFIYCEMTPILVITAKKNCFFQFPGQNLSSGLDFQFVFKDNFADTAGSVLYGGAIDNCTLTGLDSYNLGKVFDKVVHNEADNTTSSISSDPFRICLCNLNNYPNCSQSMKTLSVYPGETFQVSVVAVGQRNGIVPAAVRSNTDKGRLASSQYIQQTTKMCTKLNYTVFSQEDVSLELLPEGPCSTFSDKLLLKLSISQSCPPGFRVENSSMSCVCDSVLQKYTNRCNITNGLGQITRESDDTFWVGYDQSHRLTVHPQCPFDSCISHAVKFSLNNTDMQCAYNRSGLLCGACKNEYSLVIGTSQCSKCTNSHLTLLIPFALMGVALVILLLVCKLTVATGTLSGLVFYANIVGVNRNIFLPVDSFNLSVFIAWLNLDFGIEKCFYNRLDAYSKTWLQFVFPVYIWALVGLIILVSHFSQRFANLLGNNPVSVLATLILLSYAKILRTLIATAYFTHLEYPTYNRSVWFYDANIDYISGKHIPLFLVAVLVFFFLFLPYTLLLLFGQWVQAISHLRLFSWVNSARLKPFMDSYHAPYKAKHRYWPGLVLVLRFVLLLVFALNPQQDLNINLLAILVGAGILQLWAWVSGGVYKNWCLDALEGSFTLNLTILGAATHYVNHSGGNQLAVGYTSVSIAFATFIGILCYHIFQQVRHTKLWKKVPKLNLKFNKLNTKQVVTNPINDHAESVNLDHLREPWLEDLLQPTHSSL